MKRNNHILSKYSKLNIFKLLNLIIITLMIVMLHGFIKSDQAWLVKKGWWRSRSTAPETHALSWSQMVTSHLSQTSWEDSSSHRLRSSQETSTGSGSSSASCFALKRLKPTTFTLTVFVLAFLPEEPSVEQGTTAKAHATWTWDLATEHHAAKCNIHMQHYQNHAKNANRNVTGFTHFELPLWYCMFDHHYCPGVQTSVYLSSVNHGTSCCWGPLHSSAAATSLAMSGSEGFQKTCSCNCTVDTVAFVS